MDTLKPAAKKPEEDTKASDSKAPISQDKAVILKELLKKFQKFRKPRITKKYKKAQMNIKIHLRFYYAPLFICG